MAKYTMEMVLEYARVFPDNADMGDPKGSKAAKSVAAKGGQYIVNAYFTDPQQIQDLLDDGLDPKPMNNDRVIDGNTEYGIGQYMKLKRDFESNQKTFNNKAGDVTIEFGGAPMVIDLRDMENKRFWEHETDGNLGNGTRAMVQFDVYSNGAGVRLEKVGVLDLVEWETNEGNSKYADDGAFEV